MYTSLRLALYLWFYYFACFYVFFFIFERYMYVVCLTLDNKDTHTPTLLILNKFILYPHIYSGLYTKHTYNMYIYRCTRYISIIQHSICINDLFVAAAAAASAAGITPAT